nr:Fe-S-containing protein [Ignavibacterium sp.]MEB2297350.1 Fe-S-containing protein [Ignavibacteria bacterium]
MSEINYCPQCGKKINGKIKFCPSCGYKITEGPTANHNGSNSKRERVLNQKNIRNKKGIITAGVIVLFVSAIIFYINAKPSKEEVVIKQQPKITDAVNYPLTRFDHFYSIAFARDGKIILPLDVVKEKKFVKFDYQGTNSSIPLLAFITEDGKVVTAISLCEPCDSKDFHIQGSNLICNSCGTTWDLNNLDAISGSCGKYPPDPVPSKIVGNEIQIDEYVVTSWTRRN